MYVRVMVWMLQAAIAAFEADHAKQMQEQQALATETTTAAVKMALEDQIQGHSLVPTCAMHHCLCPYLS
jgi:hypothetical protein